MLLRFPCKNDVRFIFASILVVGLFGIFKLFLVSIANIISYHMFLSFKINTANTTYSAGTAYYSGAPEFTPLRFSRIRVAQYLILFCVVFCAPLYL